MATRRGIRTDVWGPHAWEFLHAVTFGYPDNPTPQEQLAAKQLFESLRVLLPCPKCSTHYCQAMQEFPVEPHTQSKDQLSHWLVDFHNRVNARLGKSQIPYETVAAKYQANETQCPVSELASHKQESVLPTIAVVVVILAVLAYAGAFLFPKRT